jgi:hypothetical protein
VHQYPWPLVALATLAAYVLLLRLLRIQPVRADIRGEAFNFTAGLHATNTPFNATLHFRLSLCNHSSTSTNISDVVLDGSKMAPPATFSGGLEEALEAARDPEHSQGRGIVLRSGIKTDLPWRNEIEIPDRQLSDIRNGVDLSGLKIHVIDGFGRHHPIQVRHGEMLSL